MNLDLDLKLTDLARVVMGSPIIGALDSADGDCDYVALKNCEACTIVINVTNEAADTVGGDITLLQATAVDGSDEKPLAFATMLANLDCAAGDSLTETDVTSDTFTTDATASKNLLYVIEVQRADLDVAGGFNCLRADCASMAHAAAAVLYIVHQCRDNPPGSVIVD